MIIVYLKLLEEINYTCIYYLICKRHTFTIREQLLVGGSKNHAKFIMHLMKKIHKWKEKLNMVDIPNMPNEHKLLLMFSTLISAIKE